MEIVHYPHPALLKPTQEIKPGDYPDLEERIRDMLELMYQGKGVGLAAPQVAWSVRLCVINPTLDEGGEMVLVNPKVVDAVGREVGEEGCLSFPGIYGKILRALTITVEYQDERFQPKRQELSGFAARVIQHEIDHLDNILLIHRMSEAEKVLNRRKINDLKAKIKA